MTVTARDPRERTDASPSDQAWSARAAVVELLGMHDEVVPSVCRLLRDNGVQPTVFLNREVSEKRGDLFDVLPERRDTPQYRPLRTRADWSNLRAEVHAFDLLVLNTFQTDEAAEFAAELGLPTIGLVHNARRLLKSAPCVSAVRARRVSIMTLAPHVTEWLRAKDPEVFGHTATIGHWFWDMPVADRRVRQVQRISVPGAVRFSGRDYTALLDSIPAVTEALPEIEFEIAVLGSGRDRGHLEQMVRDAALDGWFRFAPMDPKLAKVSSSVYYRELAESSFLAALLPPNHPGYRMFKITSVVPASLGFGIPLILDGPTADVYAIPCVPHPPLDLASGVIHALSLDDDAYSRIRSDLEQCRASAVAQANGEAARLLRRVVRDDKRWRRRLASMRESLGSLAAKAGRVRRSGAAPDRDDPTAFLEFVRQALRHSYAQRFQDLWALWECGLAADGYFVEFGAQHGLYGSNTYLLEQLGWNGVVAEPHPDYGEELHQTRTCAISTKCVYDRSGEVVRFQAVTGRPALSTIEGFGDDLRRDLRTEYVVHDVETISLNDLLAEASAPRMIQFLSVDTEGSELRILRAFDFSRHDVACICVEHNYQQREELHELLAERGFRRKWPKLSGQDDWYVDDAVIPPWDPDRIPTALSSMRSVPPASKTYERRLRRLDRIERARSDP